MQIVSVTSGHVMGYFIVELSIRPDIIRRLNFLNEKANVANFVGDRKSDVSEPVFVNDVAQDVIDSATDAEFEELTILSENLDEVTQIFTSENNDQSLVSEAQKGPFAVLFLEDVRITAPKGWIYCTLPNNVKSECKRADTSHWNIVIETELPLSDTGGGQTQSQLIIR